MVFLNALFCLVLAFISFFYFQMPMFFSGLPFSWISHSKWQRRGIRVAALLFYMLFLFTSPPLIFLILVSIPFGALLAGSLFFSSSRMFTGLAEADIVKKKAVYADEDIEIVGYVSEGGEAIGYPIYEMVSPRHIVHDQAGKDKILVTYCPACGSCMIFNRVVNGAELSFEVANGIYRRNMLIKDAQTGSIWQQGVGEAIYGELKGTQLDFLPYQQMPAKEWLKLYPDTLFAYETPSAKKGLIPQKRLAKILFSLSGMEGPPGKNSRDLPFNAKLWGLSVNGIDKAYPVAELKKTNGTFLDFVGDAQVEITYNPANNSIQGKQVATQKPVVFQNTWWIGWVEFHPQTKIWRAP